MYGRCRCVSVHSGLPDNRRCCMRLWRHEPVKQQCKLAQCAFLRVLERPRPWPCGWLGGLWQQLRGRESSSCIVHLSFTMQRIFGSSACSTPGACALPWLVLGAVPFLKGILGVFMCCQDLMLWHPGTASVGGAWPCWCLPSIDTHMCNLTPACLWQGWMLVLVLVVLVPPPCDYRGGGSGPASIKR